MTMTETGDDTVIDDNIFAAADSFKKRGNWTEERREILKNVTIEDIAAEADRLKAENPGKYLSPEELRAKFARLRQEWAAERAAAEMAEA